MRSVALLISIFVVGSIGSELDCPIECFNNSTCASSNASFADHPLGQNNQPFDFHKELSRDGKHCACKPGWTGLRCARPYESCNSDQHTCYHGGLCVPGIEDVYTNPQFFCDCKHAVGPEGLSYVGRYCEIAATTKCDDSGKSFCVNGQMCKPNFQDTPLEPCDCGNDYEGPHCEFKKGSVPRCTMECHNGGSCRLGLKDIDFAQWAYEDFWRIPSSVMYCQCPDGFTGTNCEIPAAQCGNKHCFNGGTCLATTPSGGPVCDCTTADKAGSSYAGVYCQYEATSYCEKKSDEDGQGFCTNGGTCNPGGAHLPCQCPEKFGGPMCEYLKETETIPTCSLQCENNGVCKKGVKDVGTLKNYGPSLAKLVNQTHNENFEYCDCPDGFVGLTCNKKVEACGNGEHICLHGAKCAQDGDGYKCHCDPAFTAFNRVAGKFCENTATFMCTVDQQPGEGADILAFCVNGGKCVGVADGNGHPGCDCPAGYTGDHCEYLSSEVESARGPKKAKAGVVISAVCVSIVVLVLVGAIVYWRRNELSQAEDLELKPATTTSSDDSNSPVLDMGPEKDLDGNELENIEIL